MLAITNQSQSYSIFSSNHTENKHPLFKLPTELFVYIFSFVIGGDKGFNQLPKILCLNKAIQEFFGNWKKNPYHGIHIHFLHVHLRKAIRINAIVAIKGLLKTTNISLNSDDLTDAIHCDKINAIKILVQKIKPKHSHLRLAIINKNKPFLEVLLMSPLLQNGELQQRLFERAVIADKGLGYLLLKFGHLFQSFDRTIIAAYSYLNKELVESYLNDPKFLAEDLNSSPREFFTHPLDSYFKFMGYNVLESSLDRGEMSIARVLWKSGRFNESSVSNFLEACSKKGRHDLIQAILRDGLFDKHICKSGYLSLIHHAKDPSTLWTLLKNKKIVLYPLKNFNFDYKDRLDKISHITLLAFGMMVGMVIASYYHKPIVAGVIGGGVAIPISEYVSTVLLYHLFILAYAIMKVVKVYFF